MIAALYVVLLALIVGALIRNARQIRKNRAEIARLRMLHD